MRKRVVAVSLCAMSTFLSGQDAGAAPGMASSKSVKELTQMLRQYTGFNASNIHQIEHKLRDRPTEASEALVNILDTNDEQLKVNAAQLLQRFSSNNDFSMSDDNIKTIIGILNACDNVKIQTSLIGTLGNIGPKNELLKNTIITALKESREPSVRKVAVDALSRLAKEEKPSMHAVSTAVLIGVLKKDDAPSVRAAAAQALGQYKDAPSVCVPALTDALEDNYGQVRSKAVQALSQYGKAATPALPKIIEILKSDNGPTVRYSCMNALRAIAPRSPQVIEAYITMLDDDQNTTDAVLNCMVDIGPEGAPAVLKLASFLTDPKHHHRIAAARALQSIGPDAKAAIPALNAAIQSAPDEGSRMSFEHALRAIQTTPPATTDGAQVSNQ